mmetsp:Transcript_44531/g.32635  ORF Transcript_44531/g.32635 Transcript_44531/m.32635 type:complete len:339 (+) Transcript_44531:53-1069(+)
MSFTVGVVGAGVVGLSVALKLKEDFGSRVNVTIIAEHYVQGTTSFGSGGFWEPYAIAGTADEDINRWGQISFSHFCDESNKETAAESGVQMITVHQLYEEHEELKIPSWSNIVHNFQLLDIDALQKMGLPRKYVKGYSFGSYVADQKYYLQYLMKLLKNFGVKFVQRRLDSLRELHGKYDCIINCTGLGSHKAIDDQEMYPIRGQVLRVRAPWMKGVWFFGKNYVIPNSDNVVLGGTQQKDDWNTNVDINDTDTILRKVGEVFPALAKAPIENIWVGLRPGRAPLRLDSEEVNGQFIIHNYGHGGSGITLAMGCAHDVVVNHLIPWLTSNSKLQRARL